MKGIERKVLYLAYGIAFVRIEEFLEALLA